MSKPVWPRSALDVPAANSCIMSELYFLDCERDWMEFCRGRCTTRKLCSDLSLMLLQEFL